MMTGWTSEPPEAERPALPLTGQLLRNRERGPGDALEIAAARSRAADAREAMEAQASAPDPDERAAAMVARGVMPGAISDLGQRLADTEAELAAEREKIEKGERVNARVRGMLERGQVGGLAAAAMMDGDFGDAGRAERLERRAEGLRRQVADTAAMIAPPQERQLDGIEEAGRRAHAVFAETTRARFADAQAGRPAPRPFAGRGGAAVRSEQVAVRSEQCVYCTADGVSDETAFLLHSDPELNVPVTPPGAVVTDRYPGEPEWETGVPFRSAPLVPGEIIRATEGTILGTR